MQYGVQREVKRYYSISEACSLLGVEKHILRYWENEFPQLSPKKNRAGNRIYRKRDIELLKLIKHLLQEKLFTIAGAIKYLNDHSAELFQDEEDSSSENAPPDKTSGISTSPSEQTFGYAKQKIKQALKKELQELLKILEKSGKSS